MSMLMPYFQHPVSSKDQAHHANEQPVNNQYATQSAVSLMKSDDVVLFSGLPSVKQALKRIRTMMSDSAQSFPLQAGASSVTSEMDAERQVRVENNALLEEGLDEAEFTHRFEALLMSNQTKSEKIQALSHVVDSFLQGEKIDVDNQLSMTLKALKKLTGERGNGSLVMAQIKSRPGDVKGNAVKIMNYIRTADAIGADTIVFPELAVMGYPVEDFITREPYVVKENLDWVNAIAKETKGMGVTAMVGFVEPRVPTQDEQRVGKDFYNAVAIIKDGEIKGVSRKSLLPNYSEFNDWRTFEPSKASGVFDADNISKVTWDKSLATPVGKTYDQHGYTNAVTICEDTWNDVDFFRNQLYERDPMSEQAENDPDVMINISASPSREGKDQLKHNMLSHIAKEKTAPYVYVNAVGAIDGISYDGQSRVYDADGNLIARAKSFEEQFLVCNPLTGEGVIEDLPKGLDLTLTHVDKHAKKDFTFNYEPDMGRTYQSVIQGIRDYFEYTGFQKAVLGLSGGLDSAVNAVLLADALGPENVLAISMPSKITSEETRSDASELASNLGIQFMEVPIAEPVDDFNGLLDGLSVGLKKVWGKPVENSAAKDNVQAISRATILRQVGNEFRALPIATSDKSELYMGYATVNGDMSGALAPIGDMTKTKTFAMARWLNENRYTKDAIPNSVIARKPGAELEINPETGEMIYAEDVLPPYPMLDEIIERHQYGQSYHDMMAATFTNIENELGRPLSQEEKEKHLKNFYRRKQRAVFKWELMPPVIMTSAKGITKAEYHQPLTLHFDHAGADNKAELLAESSIVPQPESESVTA